MKKIRNRDERSNLKETKRGGERRRKKNRKK